MPCYHQQLAVRMPGRTQNGKQPLKFIGKASSYWGRYRGAPIGALLLPCRQCIGCRLERSRQWATRLVHETKFHRNSCFLTLTYDNENLPDNESLKKAHLQTFYKDLRSRLSYYGKEKIKHFSCGEYGEGQGERAWNPHYHAALFGGPFSITESDDDRTQEEPSRSGGLQFSHRDIGECWPYGRHTFSELNFETAAYVARYVLKKISGPFAQAIYEGREPEFQNSSNGLGREHVETWKDDVYGNDKVVLPLRGEFTPPPYYDRVLEKIDPGLFEKIKKKRQEAHEEMTSSEWFEHVNRRLREGKVRTLVTEQTLIRGGF